jgi:preprotein translocase SecE subunit
MRLVRWPSAKEVTKYTIAVLVFVLFFAGFFFLINFLFSLITGLKG